MDALDTKSLVQDSIFKKIIKNIFFRDIIKKSFILGISILLSRINFFGIPFLLTLPIVAFSYAIGSPYYALAILGTFLGAITLSVETMLQSGVILAAFFILTQGMKLIRGMKTSTRIIISTTIVDIAYRYVLIAIDQSGMSYIPILTGVFTFWMSYFFLQMAPLFHTKYQKIYSPTYIIFLGFVVCLASLGIPTFNNSFQISLIIINFVVLFLVKCTGFGVSMATSALISIILLALDASNPTTVVSLMISASVISIFSKMTKITIGSAYIALNFVVYQIIEGQPMEVLDIVNYALPAFMFIFVGNETIKSLVKRIPGQYELFSVQEETMTSAKDKINDKINLLAELFNKIGDEFEKTDNSNKLRQYLQNVYRSTCINCPKNKVCYQESTSEVVTTIQRCVQKGLTSVDVTYIENNCSKPAKLLTIIDENKKTFFVEYKYSQEYKQLKGLITNQLRDMSKVLKECGQEIVAEAETYATSTEEKVKEILEQNQFDVLYINVTTDNLGKYIIEASIAKIDKDAVINEIIPLLEKVIK